MTSMPVINDNMVVLFQRTGKRRGSYRPARPSRVVTAARRVAPQRGCIPGEPCITPHGAHGWCDNDRVCRINPFRDHTFPGSGGL
jgi:hypothetical protein